MAVGGPFAPALNKLGNNQSAIFQIVGDSTSWGWDDANWATLYGWVGRMFIALGKHYNVNVFYYEPAAGGGWVVPPCGQGPQIYTSTLGASAPQLRVQNSSTIGETLAMHQGALSTELQSSGQAWQSGPDVIVVGDGFNDGLDPTAFGSNYLTYVADVQALWPGVPIVVTTENAYTSTSEAGQKVTFAQEFQGIISAFLPGETLPLSPPLQASTVVPGVWVIDLQQAIANTGNISAYSSDGIHPNAAGYALEAAWMLLQVAPGAS